MLRKKATEDAWKVRRNIKQIKVKNAIKKSKVMMFFTKKKGGVPLRRE